MQLHLKEYCLKDQLQRCCLTVFDIDKVLLEKDLLLNNLFDLFDHK